MGEAKDDHLEFVLYLPAQNTADMDLEINTGETFRFTASGSTWQAGHSYSYSLKPVRNTLQLMSTSITPWTVETEQTINGYE